MPSASELLTISSEWTQSTGRQSRDGLIWLTPNMSTSQEIPANLFRRGPRALILKGEHNPGIIAWSLDHHVLSMPLYRNPEHDIPDIYQSHRAMLDRYQEFVMPYYQPTSAIDADWEVLLTPPFMKHWQSAHEQHCRSLGSKNYTYKASLTGNVVRAIQADKYRDSGKGISGNVQPHALHQIIAEHYKCLDADFCERISINHADMMSTERVEGFAAWEEAAREYKATHPEASVGWNSQGAMARLRHYPAQFSVDGAIMVTVPVAVVDYPKKASDILRCLEFFETRAPGSISETSNGNIEIQLPLLLIKEQAQRIDDNDSGEEEEEETEEEEEEEEELDIEGDSDEEEEEEGVPRHSTRNAQRIVITSAAWYLSRLQIEDFPVFGLVTCGEKGYLSQAWVSSRDNCCYVVDWNIQNDPFDLGSGPDRYSAFLSKLANHGQELESRFEGVRDQLLALAMSDDASILHWSTRAQLEEYEEACEDEDY